MKPLDEWLKNYYDKRPQLKRPDVNIFGEHEMPGEIRYAFERLYIDYQELSEKSNEHNNLS